MNPEKDGYEGTSTLELYDYIKTLIPESKPKTLIVAVMDTGFDIDHPDLKDNIWVNEAESNGKEGVDDDGNGFVDDVHGWNFLGDATNLSLEVTRELKRLKKEKVSESDNYYKKVITEYNDKIDETKSILKFSKETLKQITDAEKILQKKNYPTDPDKLKDISPTLKDEYKDAANTIMMLKLLYGTDKNELLGIKKDYEVKMNVLFDTTSPSTLIGDNPNELDEKNYGNNNIHPKGELHGTHVTGIIAANKKGIGQAPFVKIMCLRVVPDEGDERDKDVANGIRYATDNGASIINLSAGKYFSPNSNYVTEAIKYAESKGVLFVVASGNEGTDIGIRNNYPPKFYMENGQVKYFTNMLVVGASTWMQKWNQEKDPDNLTNNYDLSASFSNYSEKFVDLFAPGVEINSTIPGGGYKTESGTSMAAPEATGVAAIIKGFFPDLKAADLKIVLMNSVRKYDGLKVKVQDGETKILFSSLSRSGGVIDVLRAYKYALENKN
jgi:subtilisin family serine protease